MLWPDFEFVLIIGWSSLVIPAWSTPTLIGLLILAGIGAIYWLVETYQKRMNYWLIIVHFVFTFFSLYWLLFHSYLDDRLWGRNYVLLEDLLIGCFLMLLFGQVLFLGNLGWALVRKNR